jgi:5-methylcytosine-specific restriction endonuclease McrA
MRCISPPLLDAVDEYRRISASRRPPERRERLLQARTAVGNSYATYRDSPMALASLSPANTSPATGEDLRGNYESKSQAKTRFRGAILAHNAGGRCCLCSYRPASTLDHYLPRASYPEFSVLPLNLAPACWECNHAKGDVYLRDDAGPAFLHAYLDLGLRGIRFLFGELATVGGEPMINYYVEPPQGLPDELGLRIRSHFTELDLEKHYLYEAINELNERRHAVASMWEAGADVVVVQDYFRREADSVAAASGANHWRFVLLEALALQPEVFRPA